MIAKEKKQAIIAEYGLTEGDTGSPEVQVAILTARIQEPVSYTHLIPYGIYQTDLEFQNETRTALDMTLLGVNEETGDLLAAVEPDYLSSIEPVYTQMDLDAISVANSRVWNQVLVDAGAIFGYTDSVNQTQLINLDGFQYTDYADAEVTSIQYQDISVLGDSLFVRMQLLGHFAKDGACLSLIHI